MMPKNVSTWDLALRTGFVLALVVSMGCGHWQYRPLSPAQEAAALELLEGFRTANQELQTFKGLGKLTLRRNGGVQTVRVAWVGAEPGKLRIEVFATPGNSALSLAVDGRWLYFDAHDGSPVSKRDWEDASLYPVVAVKITAADIVALLAGRVPIHPFERVLLKRDESSFTDELVLKRNWFWVSQKITCGPDDEVVQMELLEGTGKLIYRAVFEQMQRVDGYRVPRRLVVTDGRGNSFHADALV